MNRTFFLRLWVTGVLAAFAAAFGGCDGGSGDSSNAGSAGSTTSNCPPCGVNTVCEEPTGTCQCAPGYIIQNGACAEAPPGDPSARTASDVCQQWKDGHVVTTPEPMDMTVTECNAGALKPGAIADTITRMNMFRWLVALAPTVDDPMHNAGAQLCANLEAWWDFSAPVSPHTPPMDTKCFTEQGAAYAGMSNIAWGSYHPANAVDQLMRDDGNETTLGHRRWIVNPPLSPVGIGYWEKGGQYGNAECMYIFGMSGTGPDPQWVAVPNQGFVPIDVAQWTWSIHGNIPGLAGGEVSVLRVDDNTPVKVTVRLLMQGYGEDALSWVLDTPAEVGKTYRVTVTPKGNGSVPITYDVKPVACN
jgi:hypothetical protein